MGNKRDGKENGSVVERRNKNLKTGLDVNMTQGEKRQNKFYWPKIDTVRKGTPKPKTPKGVTPKPRKKYVRKNDVVGSKSAEQFSQYARKHSTCMQVLNFKDDKVSSLNFDINVACLKPMEQVLVKTRKGSACMQVLNFRDDVGSNLNLGIDGSMPVEQSSEETKKDSTCNQVSNCTDHVVPNSNLDMGVKPEIKFQYYRRKWMNKKKPGFIFQEFSKRKRSNRKKSSIEALEKLGFDKFMISKDILDKIAIMRGKAGNSMPQKSKIDRKSFKCVFSILSPSMKLRKKRRSKRRFSKRNNVAKEMNDYDKSSSTIIPFGVHPNVDPPNNLIVVMKEEEVPTNAGECNIEIQTPCSVAQDVSLSIPYIKEAKKQKKGRKPYKTKAKHHDYLEQTMDYLEDKTKAKENKLSIDWHGESLEEIMDPFIRHFQSLEIYDNPKALERWSVQFNTDASKADGVKETYEEKVKQEDEKRKLLLRMSHFVSVMTQSQGSRDFVKWNGSVLDSVVGVFLTQNVSDVSSSNTYMELGARFPLKSSTSQNGILNEDSESTAANVVIEHPEEDQIGSRDEELRSKDFDTALEEMLASYSDLKTSKGKQGEESAKFDWDAVRIKFAGEGPRHRKPDTRDSVDWEAVRNAPVKDIVEAIKKRGQQQVIAETIKDTLNRIFQDHGSLDLEWLREAPPQVAKAYLLSFHGLGLKSVECLRLLTLHHHAFPVDVNIARIAVRLGWVPLRPLPLGLHFHLLEKYPLENEIQKYLWPRLCHLGQKTLYKLHYHMITFGKVFCSKKKPNCGACPFKGECKYYASVVASKFALPRAQERRMTKSKKGNKWLIKNANPFSIKRNSCKTLPQIAPNFSSSLDILHKYHMPSKKCDPIVEMPLSPEPQVIEPDLPDIEDLFTDDHNENKDEEILEIKLNIADEFKQKIESCFEENNIPFCKDELSRDLISLSGEDSFISLPKHMTVARLRTEHQVYELPDSHPLLINLDRRDEKDPLPYLLAIWTPDQLGNAGNALKVSCDGSSENPGEDTSLTVPGTLLIPSRTANRGSFALNGTYFQVNEVFVDDETSKQPIDVPREWIWNLRRRTLYCGKSTTSIFKGLKWEEIKQCCCEGFICTRGFNRQSRAPKDLPSLFHNRETGKKSKKGEKNEEDDN